MAAFIAADGHIDCWGLMSNHAKKKAREKFLLEHFLRNAKISALIVDAPEPPDFVIEHDGRRIGIELTDTYVANDDGPLSLQAQEAIAERIVSRAHDLYMQERSTSRVNVQVVFIPGRISPKLNRENAAQQLARIVANHSVNPNEYVVLRSEDHFEHLPESIAYVRILGTPEMNTDRWSVAGAGWVAPLTAHHIEERIRAKSTRLPRYKEVAAENWLVIVCEGRSPSQFFDRQSIQSLGTFHSPFNRTYFYEHFSGTVLSLTRE